MRRMLPLLLAAAACAQQPPGPSEIEREQLRQMLSLRRVYVDRLGTEPSATQLRDMIIAALGRARLFLVTEDETQADAFLRGSAEELLFTEVRSSRDGLQVRAAGSTRERDRDETAGASASIGVGETESRYSSERKREAAAALRLVARNGDVLWSAAQESAGGKYRGSSRDVAEKLVKELQAAYARARTR